MKVVLVNGSPHENGCTAVALNEVAKTLNENGVETDFFWLGLKPISGCIGCYKCNELGKCFINDIVNDFTKIAEFADGFIFGTPVHYAGASGAITSFMDRAFFSGSRGNNPFRLKPAACVVSARRGGTTAAFEQINKYFTISEMPIVSSSYWNMVHGSAPEDVLQDEEGLHTMRTLGRNMAYLLKCIDNGAEKPELEPKLWTNFIR